jgi:hypothetical protein
MGRFLRTLPVETVPAYEKQPLPLVGIYSSYNNSPDCSVYDSDFNLVSRSTQSNGGNAWPTSGEIWSDYTGWNYTNGHVSSSGASSYWVKATTCYSVDGHQLMRLSPNGCLAVRQPAEMGSFMANFGVIVGPEGYRQPMSLWFSGTTLRQYTRGGFAQLDQLTTGLSAASATTWNGTNTNMRGAVGYHWVAGLLVLIEARDTSCNYRAHIWKHPTAKLSGKPGELNQFILEAKAGSNGASYQYVDFSWSANGSTSYTESQYRMRVIPTKSGRIALVRFVPHNCSHMAVLTPGVGNTGTLDTNFTTVSCTTSYGIEQGSYYGMRHQITWDNQWVAAFAPYYYYGSGLSGHVVNTDDPTRYYRLSYSSSSCGVSIIPIRASGLAYSFHENNADSSQGLNVGVMDFSGVGFQTTGMLTNGGAVSLSTSRYWIDTGYTSTNYPCLMPVENWKI